MVKKLKELEEDGILAVEFKGNLKLYSINTRHPLYKEYRNIILKTVGFEEKIKTILGRIKGIKNAFIYGSYVQNKMLAHSDIDLLVVGDHDTIALQRAVNKLQREINREINVLSMGVDEFKKRKKKKDQFLLNVIKGKHIEFSAIKG